MFLLFKCSLLSNENARFAGGKHVFDCIARTLAGISGQQVHVLTTCTRDKLMLAAAVHGFLPRLQFDAINGVVHFQHQGCAHHVFLLQQSGEPQAASLSHRITQFVMEIVFLAPVYWMVVDADESHVVSVDGKSLFEVVVSLSPSRTIALVQNVHFLPFGPSGTCPRRPDLLDAWERVSQILCVSNFVANYVASHSHASSTASKLCIVRPNAWHTFGQPPFRDFGSARAQAFGTRPFVVGVLKLTPEKGASIVFELAKLLPELQFVAVSPFPEARAVAARFANVQVCEPQSDIDVVLSQVDIVMVPSLWLEAFGLVVVDSMLRGLPVVVSDVGGLSEAGLGAALVVSVQPMEIPVDSQGVPDWAARRYRKQDVSSWVDAITCLLGSKEAYVAASSNARGQALKFVSDQQAELQSFLQRVQGED